MPEKQIQIINELNLPMTTDKEKMDAVKKQNPNVKILIVEKQQLEEFMLGKQIW